MKGGKVSKTVVILTILFLFNLIFVAHSFALEGRGAIVFAHPDDEAIIFSSVIPQVSLMILAAQPGSEVYRNIIKKYPEELGVRGKWYFLQGVFPHDWAKEVAHNKELRESFMTDEFLYELLKSIIMKFDFIITHSPWGEYGHPKHKQLYRVCEKLAIDLKKDLYVWEGVVDPYTLEVSSAGLNLPSITLTTDYAAFEKMKQAYLDAEKNYVWEAGDSQWDSRLWTWGKDWTPPDKMTYYQLVKGGKVLIKNKDKERITNKVGTTVFGDGSILLME